MSDALLEGTTSAAPDTGPEVTPLGEGRMVREDCWREVHRLFHVEGRGNGLILKGERAAARLSIEYNPCP
jgi:hypothetical protein